MTAERDAERGAPRDTAANAAASADTNTGADADRPQTVRAVIALGGNLGDRVETLRRAIHAIDALEGVTVIAASSLYESAALTLAGIDDNAPKYLNAVVIATTRLQPDSLLFELQRIEDRFGRHRAERWSSRTLDLDVIDFDGRELASDTIELPHPRAWERAFVLAPWHEIEPDAHLTGRGSVADLLSIATDRVDVFAESNFGACSPRNVSTDRGLPVIGPDSQADPPRPIRSADRANDAEPGPAR